MTYDFIGFLEFILVAFIDTVAYTYPYVLGALAVGALGYYIASRN